MCTVHTCERKCAHVYRTRVTDHTQASSCRHKYMSVCRNLNEKDYFQCHFASKSIFDCNLPNDALEINVMKFLTQGEKIDELSKMS